MPANEPYGSISGPSLRRQFSQSLVSLLFPTSCPVCAGELTNSLSGGLCNECWSALEPWIGNMCSHCGLPIPTRVSIADPLCGDCHAERPRFDYARSYGVYGGTLRRAVLELKFHRRERLGVRLGHLLVEPWLALQSTCDLKESGLIVPVPLHKARERERGYNQAALLARGLAQGLRRRSASRGFRLDCRVVTRSRSTLPQSGLSVQGRHENVRRVFHVTKPEHLHDRDVILVDDVMTTCATASACAAELKRAGAQRVVVLSLARATPLFPDVVGHR